MDTGQPHIDSLQDTGFDYRSLQSSPKPQFQHSHLWLQSEHFIGFDSFNSMTGNVMSSSIDMCFIEKLDNFSSGIFPFFDLPSEVRLIIYHMAFCRNEPVLFRTRHHTAGIEDDNHSSDDGFHQSLLPSHEHNAFDKPRRRGQSARRRLRKTPPYAKPCKDPLVPELLRVCKQIYQEARPVLYAGNTFILELESAARTLTSLSQPSRSSIKYISLSVPTHHDIIEGFADLVRLHLRYCWGLKKLTLTLPHFFPQDRYAASSGTNVYANSFHILRWLPQGTKVLLEGGATDEIKRVISENTRMGQSLDKVGTRLVIFPEISAHGWMCRISSKPQRLFRKLRVLRTTSTS
jgi:hypothetical protein